MKILQTIPILKKLSGGPVSCTYHLVRGLNSIGVKTDLYTNSSLNPMDDIGYDTFIKYVPNDMYSPLCISKNLEALLNTQMGGYDLVHSNTLWLWTPHLTCKLARDFSKPYIVSPHGMLYPEGLKQSRVRKMLYSLFFQGKDIRQANLLHATCRQEMQNLRELGVTQPIAVVPNCLYLDSVPMVRQIENSVRRFGFVGRLHPYKNVHLILKAWKDIYSHTNDCELVIVGDGDKEYVSRLKAYVHDEGLKNVTFTGFLSADRLNEAVAALDFQILFSVSENFAMVVPEALVRGVPVICSQTAPWEELNNHGCGWWINHDLEALKETILETIHISEDKRRLMGDKGRNLILNNYLVEQVSASMSKVYKWILEGGERPNNVYE